MQNNKRKNTLTVREAAEYLSVHTDTIYSMVREKEIPHFKVRSRIFLSIDSLDKWIQKQEEIIINKMLETS